jgi:hypothetical protein
MGLTVRQGCRPARPVHLGREDSASGAREHYERGHQGTNRAQERERSGFPVRYFYSDSDTADGPRCRRQNQVCGADREELPDMRL